MEGGRWFRTDSSSLSMGILILLVALHLGMDVWCQVYVSEDLFIIPPKRGTSESQYQYYCIAYIILALEYTMESLIVSFHFVPTLSLPPYF